jgi:hypothetical protein
VSDRPTPAPITRGFLTVVQEPAGWVGGYLVTNAWGRPLEFRLSTAVQPTRVQSVLYGPTLAEYLHADVIGKTLVEKTSIKPDLVVTDALAALALRSRIDVPVVAVKTESEVSPELPQFAHPRSSVPLVLPARFEADGPVVARLLDRTDPAVDLAEPFGRVREAVAEARKAGVTSRAA